MRVSAEYLVIFVVTIEEGSVSNAAKRLNLSQPTVSGHLKRLAEIVGEPLYERQRDGLVPTYAGKQLLPYAQNVARSLDGAVSHILEYRNLEEGQLRLGATSTIAAYHIPRVLATYRERYPNIKLNLVTGRMATVYEALEKRDVEIALLAVNHETIKPLVGLDREVIHSDSLLLCVPPFHPWCFRGGITIEELEQQNLIIREQGSATRTLLENAFAQANIKPKIMLQLSSHEAIKEAVSLGVGIGFLPESVTKRDVSSGFISTLRVQGLELKRDYTLLKPEQSLTSKSGLAFLSCLNEYFHNINGSPQEATTIELTNATD